MVVNKIEISDNWADVLELTDRLNKIVNARNAYAFLNKESKIPIADPESLIRRGKCCTATSVEDMDRRFAEDANKLIIEYVKLPIKEEPEEIDW